MNSPSSKWKLGEVEGDGVITIEITHAVVEEDDLTALH
jgi:hypothetical protein